SGEKFSGLNGSHTQQSQIFVAISPNPKRGGRRLKTMPGGRRKIPRHILPARGREQCPQDQSHHDAPLPQTTAIPGTSFPRTLSYRRAVQDRVVQNSTPTLTVGPMGHRERANFMEHSGIQNRGWEPVRMQEVSMKDSSS